MADSLIRGMEMPESCDKCRLFNECWCMALGIENWRKSYNKPEQGERLPDCPLVPLPAGHGRLGDLDALQAKFELMENAFAEHGRPYSFAFKDGGEMCAEWWTVQDALAREPTIIEAEGGGEDGNP